MPNSYYEILKNAFPFWDTLTKDQQNMLLNDAVKKDFQKGQNIHGLGGHCTGPILVQKGCVRTYLMSEDGKEITLYRLYGGDVCILSANCIIDSITFDVFIDATEDTSCIIIPACAFSAITNSSLEAQNFALNLAVSRFSDVIWAMQQMLFMSFDRRLAIFLYDELQKSNDDTINITQEQIAKYTGSAREVVSRMLKYFSSETIATTVRGCVKILDREKLKKIAFSL